MDRAIQGMGMWKIFRGGVIMSKTYTVYAIGQDNKETWCYDLADLMNCTNKYIEQGYTTVIAVVGEGRREGRLEALAKLMRGR